MRLDNELSEEHLNMMEYQRISVQLVPPCNYRTNLADRAMQTCNYLIAGLSCTDPSLPMILWDTFIPQANIAINLIRNSRIKPKLSDYT